MAEPTNIFLALSVVLLYILLFKFILNNNNKNIKFKNSIIIYVIYLGWYNVGRVLVKKMSIINYII